jgi:hypothetical protein
MYTEMKLGIFTPGENVKITRYQRPKSNTFLEKCFLTIILEF